MAGTPGVINFREIHFDTRSRVGGTISNPVFAVSDIQRIKNIQVIEAEIPKTWYVFTALNNKIDFVEPINGPVVVATISPGNYSITEMQSHLETILSAASPNGSAYTVVIDPITTKITINCDKIFNMLWTTGANAAASPAYELGFDNTVDLTGNTTYTAQNVYNMSGDNYVFIKLNEIRGNDSELTSNGGQDVKILARIPVDVNTGETIQYLATIGNPTQLLFNDESIFQSQLTFRLTERNDVLLNTNGRDWSMKIGIFT